MIEELCARKTLYATFERVRGNAGCRGADGVTDYLLAELELRLNQEKTRTGSFDQGFKFLGSVCPSISSAAGCPALFGDFIGTLDLSDFPCPFMSSKHRRYAHFRQFGTQLTAVAITHEPSEGCLTPGTLKTTLPTAPRRADLGGNGGAPFNSLIERRLQSHQSERPDA